jgi:hypothetical protein
VALPFEEAWPLDLRLGATLTFVAMVVEAARIVPLSPAADPAPYAHAGRVLLE